jgi:sodium/bile acid cotransporter 7
VVLTAQARGNASGALFNAVVSNLVGVVLTPLLVLWLLRDGGEMRPLGPVIREICVLIVLPLVAGQLLRRPVLAAVDRWRVAIGHGNNVIILFIVYAAFANSVAAGFWAGQSPRVIALAVVAVIVLFYLSMTGVGLLARWAKLEPADQVAAFFCGTQKTLAAGVPLAHVIFGAHPALGLILLPIMLYHGLQLMLGGVRAARLARRSEN